MRTVSLGLAFLACLALVLPIGHGRAQVDSEYVHQYPLGVEGPDGSRQRLLVTIVRGRRRELAPEGGRYPVVVALHGRGEARRGPARGFLGWNVDYRLPIAYGAMLRGTLRRADFNGFVRDAHLEAVNRELAARPFQKVAVVTPFTPDILGDANAEARVAYGNWIAGPMLDAVREEYPGLARTRAGTGIDGVSLGGALALEVGLRHPETFGAVGAIQPAVRNDEANLAGLAGNGDPQRIRLLTSDDDPYLEPTRQVSTLLREAAVPHELVVTPGPHNYEFNRGTGSIELLRFASAALETERVEGDTGGAEAGAADDATE